AHLLRHCRDVERGEPHRRPGWPRHHADRDGGRRARHLRLRCRQRGVLEVPRRALRRGRGRTGGVLRRAGGRGPGFPLVQRLSGGSVHGRRRRARAGRRARHHRRNRAPGDRAFHHGRRIRRRDALGDDPGDLFQVHRRQAHFPHGAAAPPLRTRRLEGIAGGSALLDHHHDAGAVRTLDAQAQMMREPAFSLLRKPSAMKLRDKRVLVLGLGDTGLSVAKWASDQGGLVRVADTRTAAPRKKEFSGELHAGKFKLALLKDVDLVCISPGLSLQEDIVQAAFARGIPILGDIELFAWDVRAHAGEKVLAVTGTNGKSTVAALTGHLLRAARIDCEVAGNIGPPALEALMKRKAKRPQAWVLELSSYQLETTWALEPEAATLLNLSEDHLDRYAGLAEYASAKARIFTGGGVQLLNRCDSASMALAQPGRTQVTFGLDAPEMPEDFGIAGEYLVRGTERIFAARELPLAGAHNASNALAACALAHLAGAPLAALAGGLRSFRGLPHRMQRVALRGGVEWLDDSKGTNVGATAAALKGLSKKAVLIL